LAQFVAPSAVAAPRRGSIQKDPDSKRVEYDFATGQRGKFHRADLRLLPPVPREPDALAYLAERALDKGISLNALVTPLLEKDIELLKIGT